MSSEIALPDRLEPMSTMILGDFAISCPKVVDEPTASDRARRVLSVKAFMFCIDVFDGLYALVER